MVKLVLTNNGVPMHLGGSDDFTHCDEGALNFLIEKYDIKQYTNTT